MRKFLVVLLTSGVVACHCGGPGRIWAQAAGSAVRADEAQASTSLKGKVLERIDAAPYSYLKLSTSSGEVWAAVPQTGAATGSEVTVADAFPMQNFESKTLKRTFDKVYFGTLADDLPGAAAALKAHTGGAAMPAGHGSESGALPPGHPPTGNGSGMAAQHQAAAAGPSGVKDVKVEKAIGPDARTVAEIHARRSDLKDKSVTVHAQVVKFNGGIMGRNWMHLRDGSGGPDKGDNDITVTTQDTAAVGDVVTAKGTVRLDKDFGAGYAYPVIIEEAQVSK